MHNTLKIIFNTKNFVLIRDKFSGIFTVISLISIFTKGCIKK